MPISNPIMLFNINYLLKLRLATKVAFQTSLGTTFLSLDYEFMITKKYVIVVYANIAPVLILISFTSFL